MPSGAGISGAVASPFGAPTLGTGGFEPLLIAAEPAIFGSRWTIAIDGALGGRPAGALFSLGNVPSGQPFQGAMQFVGGRGTVIRRTTLNGAGPGDGWGSVGFDIADNPALVGLSLYAQWFVLDPTAPGVRLSASVAVSATQL